MSNTLISKIVSLEVSKCPFVRRDVRPRKSNYDILSCYNERNWSSNYVTECNYVTERDMSFGLMWNLV